MECTTYTDQCQQLALPAGLARTYQVPHQVQYQVPHQVQYQVPGTLVPHKSWPYIDLQYDTKWDLVGTYLPGV